MRIRYTMLFAVLLSLSSTGWCVDSVPTKLQLQIVESLQSLPSKLSPSAKAIIKKLDLEGLTLADLSCESAVLAPIGSSKVVRNQSFLEDAVMKLPTRSRTAPGACFTPARILSAEELQDLAAGIDLQISIKGSWFFYTARDGLRSQQESLRKQIEQALSNPKDFGLRHGEEVSAYITDYRYRGEGSLLTLGFALTYENGETQKLLIESHPIGSANAMDAVADIMTAAIQHRKVLSQKKNLAQERNMMSYTLHKLLHVALPAYQGEVTSLVKDQEIPSQGLFESNANFLGRSFVNYLETKRGFIGLVQKYQVDQNKVAQVALPQAADAATDPLALQPSGTPARAAAPVKIESQPILRRSWANGKSHDRSLLLPHRV